MTSSLRATPDGHVKGRKRGGNDNNDRAVEDGASEGGRESMGERGGSLWANEDEVPTAYMYVSSLVMNQR